MTTTPTLQPQHTEPRPSRPRRRVWAFAAAFVGVVVAVGLAALLLSDAEPPVTDQPPTTIDRATTTTSPYGWPPFHAPAVEGWPRRIVAPDGTEWGVEAPHSDRSGVEFRLYDGTEFTSVGAPETSDGSMWVSQIAVTTDGTVWAASGLGWTPDRGGLARFDGTDWELMRPLGDKELPAAALAATPDGSLWAVIVDIDDVGEGFQERYELVEWTLARFDGSGWTLYPQATEFSAGFPGGLEALGDTVLLVNGGAGYEHLPLFKGVVVFDGQSWRHYLDDEMVIGITITQDGTVLANTLESGRQRLDL